MWFSKYIRNKLVVFKEWYTRTATDTLDIILRILIASLISFTIIWVAVFMYVVFYYTYVPSIEHVKPANLQFEHCDGLKGICSFPTAHVQLTKSDQLLMVGQPYKISLVLDMPESPKNKDLGMFMVCARLQTRKGRAVAISCRSTMLKYYSQLVRFLKTMSFAPLFVVESMEEKQTVTVELFPSYEEDQNFPVTDIFVEIRSSVVEIYSCLIRVSAQMHGLRYMMYNWPLLSAALGISFNLLVILFLITLSWWQLYGPYSGREYLYDKLKNKLCIEGSKTDDGDDTDDIIDDQLVEKKKETEKPEGADPEREFIETLRSTTC